MGVMDVGGIVEEHSIRHASDLQPDLISFS
jgi:hypothetical protein